MNISFLGAADTVNGWLPVLVREGFKGSIHCSPATRDLAEVLLLDSAHLQEAAATTC